MKIALFDPYWPKFTGDMVDWWRENGHEVRTDRYYNPEVIEWADVVWFDTCDNNIKSATNPSEAILADDANFQPWDLHQMNISGKKIIVRPIDIEVWLGHQEGSKWDVVTDVVFIADHIKDLMVGMLPDHIKVHTIPCSVNLGRYRFAERAPGKDVAIVSEKWTSKGTDLILQIALKLKGEGFRFHWLGRWSDHPWEIKYFEDFIAHHGLDFTFTEWIEGDNAVDEFLEDKNYLLHASHKEAFSYATAEAMAKGIRPVIHRFYGSDALWPGLTWSSVDEACAMLTDGRYDSDGYLRYLYDSGYTLPQMMEAIDNVIKGE